MSRLLQLAIAWPRPVLALWLTVVGALGLVGLGLESKLHRSDLVISGTATEKAVASLEPRFGETFDAVVLLEGPAGEIGVQGRRLARRIERIEGVSVLAPWMAGSSDSLRPRPGAALLIVRAEGDFEHVSKETVPLIRAASARTVRPPLRWHVSGYPDIAAGIHGGTVDAIEKAELVAIPLLLVILLFVFRSPIAAALPLFVGLTAIGGVRGVLAIVNGFYPLDALALNVASMMGLALGVDYALLMVSRFREQLAEGDPPQLAAVNAARAAGHTVVSAGIALVAAMAATVLVVPGNLLTGVGVGLIAGVALCVLAALTALPAALTLLGAGVDRWTFGDVNRPNRLGGLALRALRRPVLAVVLVVALVGGLSAYALALETGPPDPRALPPGSVERNDYQAVRDALGAGWIAPYEIAIASDRGPFTERARLNAMDRFQRRLVARPDVAAVLGPGRIARRTRPLGRVPGQLRRANRVLRDGLRNQDELAKGLARAGGGVGELRSGLAEAAEGAGRLRAGGEDADDGARQLHAGVAAARRGVDRLRGGLGAARGAVTALATGSRRATAGSARVGRALATSRAGLVRGLRGMGSLSDSLAGGADDLRALRGRVQDTRDDLERGLLLLDQLPPTVKTDSSYQQARGAFAAALAAVSGEDPQTGAKVEPGYDGLDATLAGVGEDVELAGTGVATVLRRSRRLAGGLRRLRSGSLRLAHGMRRLDAGAGRLLRGFDALDGGGGDLAGGLGELETGSDSLATGVGRLASGAGDLRDGLSDGTDRIGALQRGVGRMRREVLVFRSKSRSLDGQTDRTNRLTPTFESGYFTLAALDRARPPLRRTASFALNVDRGGDGARIVVVGYGDAQKDGHPLRAALEDELGPLSKATGGTARLGGTATGLQDFDRATANRLPLLALVLTLVTFVVLVGVLRSLLLPLLAVIFNLLTVGAAFGLMVLCFQGSDPLLGGPGFVDAITAFGVFSIMFGLSIDYEVFLLARMREGYLLTRSTEGAIAYGVERTAGVITGAALIMTAVFAAFATTGITAARQLGLALTVAVLLDATLIRLVLLPAAMRLLGDASWWLPRSLRRRSEGRGIADHPGDRLAGSHVSVLGE